jgi:hypothetical protein
LSRTYVDAQSREDPTDGQPDTTVSGPGLGFIFNDSQQEISDAAHGGKSGNDYPSSAISIAEEGSGNAKQEAREVDWCGKTLGVDTQIAHIFNDGGQEVGQAGEGVVAHEMDQSMDDVAVVEEAGKELCPLDLVLCGGVSCLHALDGEGLLGFREKFGRAGSVGEEEEDDGREKNGGKALCFMLGR